MTYDPRPSMHRFTAILERLQEIQRDVTVDELMDGWNAYPYKPATLKNDLRTLSQAGLLCRYNVGFGKKAVTHVRPTLFGRPDRPEIVVKAIEFAYSVGSKCVAR